MMVQPMIDMGDLAEVMSLKYLSGDFCAKPDMSLLYSELDDEFEDAIEEIYEDTNEIMTVEENYTFEDAIEENDICKPSDEMEVVEAPQKAVAEVAGRTAAPG